LKEIIKSSKIAGKGQRELYEVGNQIEHMRGATESDRGHVPGNGGT
jgi:hypothetical protein